MMPGLLDQYFPAEDPMNPAALVPAGLLNGDGSRALNKARGLLDEQPGYAYGSILPFKRDTTTGDTSLAVPGFARDSATGLLDMLEGHMTPEASMALLDIPVGGLLHAGVTGARQTPETLAAIRAYHGSPHRFDKFDMGKIGTGEGAQAYGHGLYFAESPGVARSYRDALAGRTAAKAEDAGTLGGRAFSDLLPEERHAVRMARDWKSPGAAADAAEKQGLRDRAAILRKMESGDIPYTVNDGALYTTKLDVEPDDLLDWDKPLSEQSEKVRGALEKLGVDTKNKGEWTVKPSKSGDRWTLYNVWGEASGTFKDKAKAEAKAAENTMRHNTGSVELMYNQLGGSTIYSRNGGDKGEASRILREAGIPGVKYLDQGSRAGGEGTRNFVIFDDKLIDIEGVQ